MAIYNPRTFADQLTPLRKVYALFGADDTGKTEAILAIRKVALDESFADFDCQVIDASSSPVEEILASAGSAPFSSPARLVIVKAAELYRKREKSSEAERLAEGLKRLPAQSCLVLRIAAGEDERGRKTCISTKVDNAIESVGLIFEFKTLSDEALTSWLMSECSNSGKKLDPMAASRLATVAPGDRLSLKNELDKAIAFTGDRERVTLADVEAVVYHDPEDVMFKLVDSISQHKPDTALRLFHELLRYDSKPQSVAGRLLSLLARQLKLIQQAHELIRLGVDPAQLKNLPPHIAEQMPQEGTLVSMAWKSRELFSLARNWSRERLVMGYDLLIECDAGNKGGEEGVGDIITNLEILIVRLSAVK